MAAGALIALAQLGDVASRDGPLLDVLLSMVATIFLAWLALPVLGALGCGLGCYVALRAGKQSAAFGTAGLTVVLGGVSVLLFAESSVLFAICVVGSPLLARRLAAGRITEKPEQ